MSDPTPVTIPLINPNEPEAMLSDLAVSEGQQIAAGDLLCTLETTKSSADVLAERPGYVIGLRVSAGQPVQAGDVLCYLADTPDTPPPGLLPTETGAQVVPEGLRITRPALALAHQHQLDLARLPAGRLITEQTVQALLEQPSGKPVLTAPPAGFDPTAILVYGGGGHGKMLIDLLRGLSGYNLAGVVDDGRTRGEAIMGLPVLGGGEVLAGLYEDGVRLAVNGVGGIGNISVRDKVFQKLAEAGFSFPAVVHRTACVEPSASLSPGTQVFAHAYVGSEAQVGFGSIVSTGAIVSHDCQLGAYTILSPGAILAGEVQVGEGTLIGMGATINLRVKIGAGARIGNSSTVKADVPARSVVRAGSIWPA